MNFIEPMYAASMPKELNINPRDYVIEEKWDGFRAVCHLDKESNPTVWSRLGNVQHVPPHIVTALKELPPNSYLDGEFFVPGLRSYGARELVNRPNLVYTVFDILYSGGIDLTENSYLNRQDLLHSIFDQRKHALEILPGVRYPGPTQINSLAEISKAVEEIWARDGEGIILKRKDSHYTIGKRPKNDWIKIKKLRSEALTILGFTPTRGQIMDRGNFAMTVLQDDAGVVTVVKTRNDALCRQLEKECPHIPPPDEFQLGQPTEPNTREVTLVGGKKITVYFTHHPRVNTKLRIEYQEKTPDGSYRHPRWDRYENE